MQALYAYFQSDKSDLVAGEKELLKSLQKVEELYTYLFDLLAEIHFMAERKLEDGKRKRLATQDDLNPNTKFIDNTALKFIRNSKHLSIKRADYKLSWEQEKDLVYKLYRSIKEDELYISYLNDSVKSNKQDVEILIQLFKKLIVNNELVQSHIEEQSIYWINDLDLVASMMIKTMKKWVDTDKDSEAEMLPLYRDMEDQKFAKELFRKTIKESSNLEELIKARTKNWEIERIALMDNIIMKLALVEAKTFNNIPTKVTLNEFIEIAKFYSTPKSKNFINGILDELFKELTNSGKIKKTGRGLMQ